MKRHLITLAAAAALAVAAPMSASAATWQTMNQRNANFEQRINQGIRQGDLTRAEAQRLRTEFRNLVRLENRYRISDHRLTAGERADLDSRYTALSTRIFAQRHDADTRNHRYHG